MKTWAGASITSKTPRVTRTDLVATFAKGCQFVAGGKDYIDWAMSLAGFLDGYAPDWWMDAIQSSIETNVASIPMECESLLAEKLGEFFPWHNSVRFMADGSNPNEAAVRLARAATGREVIFFQGYHGYGESFPHLPDPDDHGIDERRGIPRAMWELAHQFRWGDYRAIDQIENVAAIIVEAPPEDEGAREFLNHCMIRAREIGALFVMDEVVTGLRLAPGGAQEHYGVRADLTCLGKTLGNGVNISALLGDESVLKYFSEGVHYSCTFAGMGLSTGVALATLNWISKNKETIYPTLYSRGEILKTQMNQVFDNFEEPVRMTGNATRPILVNYTEPWMNKWRDGMFARGFYYLAHPWYVTMAHTQDVIYKTVEASYEACKEIENAA